MIDLSLLDNIDSDPTVLAVKKKTAQALYDDLATTKTIKSFVPYDVNADGMITIDDCPYSYGSPQAKLWYQNILMPYIKSTTSIPESMEYEQLYKKKFLGFYHGKPIIQNHFGPDTSNIEFIRDHYRIHHGASLATAQNVAEYLAKHIAIS